MCGSVSGSFIFEAREGLAVSGRGGPRNVPPSQPLEEGPGHSQGLGLWGSLRVQGGQGREMRQMWGWRGASQCRGNRTGVRRGGGGSGTHPHYVALIATLLEPAGGSGASPGLQAWTSDGVPDARAEGQDSAAGRVNQCLPERGLGNQCPRGRNVESRTWNPLAVDWKFGSQWSRWW